MQLLDFNRGVEAGRQSIKSKCSSVGEGEFYNMEGNCRKGESTSDLLSSFTGGVSSIRTEYEQIMQ